MILSFTQEDLFRKVQKSERFFWGLGGGGGSLPSPLKVNRIKDPNKLMYVGRVKIVFCQRLFWSTTSPLCRVWALKTPYIKECKWVTQVSVEACFGTPSPFLPPKKNHVN